MSPGPPPMSSSVGVGTSSEYALIDAATAWHAGCCSGHMSWYQKCCTDSEAAWFVASRLFAPPSHRASAESDQPVRTTNLYSTNDSCGISTSTSQRFPSTQSSGTESSTDHDPSRGCPPTRHKCWPKSVFASMLNVTFVCGARSRGGGGGDSSSSSSSSAAASPSSSPSSALAPPSAPASPSPAPSAAVALACASVAPLASKRGDGCGCGVVSSSACLSGAHTSSAGASGHSPHASLQLLSMKSALRSHSPFSAQSQQNSFSFLHAGLAVAAPAPRS
mmetsp:Transcript_2604/g.9524  ORF Transcript_2604/g.9524 Transcript_2604/m.9524 type:complete len:277 (+) Transcript_2604:1057-1887(+)